MLKNKITDISKCCSISWTIVLVVFIHGSLVCAVFMLLLHEVKNAYTGDSISFNRKNAYTLCNNLQTSLNVILTESGLTKVATAINNGTIKQETNAIQLKSAAKIQLNIGKGKGTFELNEACYFEPKALKINHGEYYYLDLTYSSSRKIADYLYKKFNEKSHEVSMQSDNQEYKPANGVYQNASYYSYTVEKEVKSTVHFKNQKDFKIINSMKKFIKSDDNLSQTGKLYLLSSILGDIEKAKVPSIMFFTFILGVIVLGLSPFIKEKVSQIYKCNHTCSLRVFIIFLPFLLLSLLVLIFFTSLKPCDEFSICIMCFILAGFFSVVLAVKKYRGHIKRKNYVMDHTHKCKNNEDLLAVVNDFQKETMILNYRAHPSKKSSDIYKQLTTPFFEENSDLLTKAESICDKSKIIIQKNKNYDTEGNTHFNIQELKDDAEEVLNQISDFRVELSELENRTKLLQSKDRDEEKYLHNIKAQIEIICRALSKLELQQKMVRIEIITPIKKRKYKDNNCSFGDI